MNMNFFEELLKKPTIFKDESKLDINFIPEKLPHRNCELSLLSQLFLALITQPNLISRKVLITGRTGIGKTATVKAFGLMLKDIAIKRNVSLKICHINCRKERTGYKVLVKIISEFIEHFPKRGYSPQDLLEIIYDLLNKQKLHLVIVLDELSYLINNSGDFIYSLTRMNDDSYNKPQHISIIGIVRQISCLNNLDDSTLSTLQRNIIKFNLYSKTQIFEILKYRVEISLKENVLSDYILESISEIIKTNGDIRVGLNLIWRAAKIAESQNLKYITTECVRLGSQELIPFSTQDIIKYMSNIKLIFLLAIIKSLNKKKKTYIYVSEAIESFQILCESINERPRTYSQLWNYLQEFKTENLISINIISEKIKGRKAIIEIPEIPLSNFEGLIIDILNSKGVLI